MKTKSRQAIEKAGRQTSILFATRGLTAFPAITGIKALVNHSYGYRLRVGNYRVMFDVSTTVQVVSIEEVKKRDEHTY